MGGGHPGCTRDPHDDFDANVTDYAGSDTGDTGDGQSDHDHNPSPHAWPKHHIVRLGGRLAECAADILDVFAESTDDRLLASGTGGDCKDGCLWLLDEMWIEAT